MADFKQLKSEFALLSVSTEYFYYGCTHHRSNSIRQEDLLIQAEKLINSIKIPKLTQSYIKNCILSMDKIGFKKRANSIKAKKTQLAKLESEMQRVIRLSGVSETVVQKTVIKISEEINATKTELDMLEATDNSYMEKYKLLLDTLELSKDLISTYQKCSLMKKAKILYFVLSHCSLINKTLVFKLKKPFCFMQNGSFIKWLPGQDSNLRHCGYDLTPIAWRVGLYHHHGFFKL